MTTTETTGTAQASGPLQVYRVYIKVAPERIWQAITDPEWNGRYGYGAPRVHRAAPGRQLPLDGIGGDEAGLRRDGLRHPGRRRRRRGRSRPTRRASWCRPGGCSWTRRPPPRASAGSPTRSPRWPGQDGVSRLTVTHERHRHAEPGRDDVAATTRTGDGGGGGWAWILSDLKSLLETGRVLPQGLSRRRLTVRGSWLTVDREAGPRMIRSPGHQAGSEATPRGRNRSPVTASETPVRSR